MKNLCENEKEINPRTKGVLDEYVRWFCGEKTLNQQSVAGNLKNRGHPLNLQRI